MKTLILILSLIIPGAGAATKYRRNFTKQLYVVDVGQFKMEYSLHGEPISRPRSLKIWVKCIGTKDWQPVGEYRMCELTKYEYDAKDKKLKVEYIDGRVEDVTGKTFCDQMGSGDLPLADVCKKRPDLQGANPTDPGAAEAGAGER